MLIIEQGHLQDTRQREREIVHPVGHRALVERLGQAFGAGQIIRLDHHNRTIGIGNQDARLAVFFERNNVERGVAEAEFGDRFAL